MNTFDSNRLVITRGNSAIIDITPLDGDTGLPIKLEEGDKVLFTIKTYGGETKFQRVLTYLDYDGEEDTSLNCVFNPEDTIDWRIGKYCYDCLLILSDGTVNTFISSSLYINDALGFYTDAEEDGNG